ncbi:MAG: type II secretion system protein [bacterium]
MKNQQPGRNKNGFSLIELVITIVISSIALYSLLTVFMTATSRSVDQEALTVALSLANSKLEIISSLDFACVNDEAAAALTGQFAGFTRAVAVDYVTAADLDTPQIGPTDYKKITVAVNPIGLPGVTIEVVGLVTDVSN